MTARLVFVRDYDLYLADAQSSNLRLVVSTGESYEPDIFGSMVVYASARENRRLDLYLLDTATGIEQRLTFDDGQDRHPMFSPDGRQIAFASDRTGNWDIYIMDTDGSNAVNVTATSYNEYAPAWSPDGQRLAYQANPTGKDEIYILNLRDGTIQQITAWSDALVGVLWSPSGDLLACYAYVDPAYWLTVNITTGNVITQGRGIVNDWLDGQTVLYHRRTDGGNPSIYARNVATGSERLVVDNASWSAVYP